MLHPRLRPVSWRRTGLALALSGGGMLAAAQAASVQEPTDVLQRPDAAVPTAVGKTLDRALSVDTHTGQSNLDLLLETRGADDVPADAAARRATTLLQPARAAAAATVGGPTAAPGSTQGAGLPETAVQREWLGSAPGTAADHPGLLATPVVTAADGADLRLPRSGGDAARETDPVLRSALVRDTAAFLRDHRYWLLGALAGAAAVVAGVQAWLRRTGDTPERRAERLTEQRGARRTRRRSTRRA